MQPSISFVIWNHPNAVTNSWVETSVEAGVVRQEMDPTGAEVGTEDPFQFQPDPTYLDVIGPSQPLYIEGGDPFDYSTGYTLDGLPMSKSQVNRTLGKAGASGLLLFDAYRIPEAFHGDLNEGLLAEFYSGTYGVSLRNSAPQSSTTPETPQNSGFRFGSNANFSNGEKERLQNAFNKLKSKECQDWFEKQLSQFGAPSPGAGWYQTLDAVLDDAVLNKYDTKLTAEQMGISQSDRDEIAQNYDTHYTTLNVANAVTNAKRIWLMPEAFWNNSTIPWNDRDLTGIIVHELFHVAGYGKSWESRIKGLSDEIKRNCSKTAGII